MIDSTFASTTLSIAASAWTSFGLTNYVGLVVGVLVVSIVITLLIRAFHHR